MKKFIFMFIAFVFILAFIIGQCNNDTPDAFLDADDFIEDSVIQDITEKNESQHIRDNSAIIDSNCNGEILKNEDVGNPQILHGVSEQILNRKAYTVSYNTDTKCPNWVAWHLTAEHADGVWPRDNNYYEDEDVPMPRATDDDYKGTPWTHGHMCPAGDNKWDSIAMCESNLLTNICPQHSGLNSGLWNAIERNCRKWAVKYSDIYIVCGPVLYNVKHETIGDNKIVVPEAFFKVILCLTGKPKAIGFVIKNNGGKKKTDQYINTVDGVERITGMDFFSSLPDSIENEVEAYANIEDWM